MLRLMLELELMLLLRLWSMDASSSCDSSIVISRREDCEWSVTGAWRGRMDLGFLLEDVGEVEFSLDNDIDIDIDEDEDGED